MDWLTKQNKLLETLAEMQTIANKLQLLIAVEKEKFRTSGTFAFYKVNPLLIKIEKLKEIIKELLR